MTEMFQAQLTLKIYYIPPISRHLKFPSCSGIGLSGFCRICPLALCSMLYYLFLVYSKSLHMPKSIPVVTPLH